MRFLRPSVFCLTAMNLVCSSQESAPPYPSATVSWTPAISPLAAASASAPSSASSGRPSPRPTPSSFARFAAEMEAACPYGSDDGSTRSMVDARITHANCQARRMTLDAGRLPISARGALLEADPKHTRGSEATPSLWSNTIDAKCRIERAQIWLYDGTMTAGTMEPIHSVGCIARYDLDLAFLMRSWIERAPTQVVDYVRARASQRPPPRERLERWRRYAPLARRTAPHQAEPECTWSLCRWSDAHWIAFERDLDTVERNSTALARAICMEWAALGSGFGGQSLCEDEITAHWLPSDLLNDSAEPTDPARDAVAPPPDLKLTPPADPIFDASTLAIRRAWARDEEAAGAAAFLEMIRRDLDASRRPDLARWTQRAEVFRDRFAVADAAAQFIGVGTASDWVTNAKPKSGPTMRLLEGYLIQSILLGDEQRLAAHVRGREPWGRTVESQLERTRDAFEQPCRPDGPRACGSDQVAARLAWLLRESRALGEALCEIAPEFTVAIGRPECPALAARHLLSFAKYLGELPNSP
jgi:hypothetical protein